MALAAAALAACSGGEERLSKADYEQTVRGSYAEVQSAFLAAGRAGPDKLAAEIAQAQAALRESAERLDGVEPPEDVEEMHEEMIEGMREFAEDLDRLQDAAEQGDAAAVASFNDEIGQNEAVEQIAEAAEEMKFKGYDLGPIAAD